MGASWTVDGVPGYREAEDIIIRNDPDQPRMEVTTRQVIDLGLMGVKTLSAETWRLSFQSALADPRMADLAIQLNTVTRALLAILWEDDKNRILTEQATQRLATQYTNDPTLGN